jgi:hypothetical protein
MIGPRMSLETGFALDGYRSLGEVCAPLADELARCYWLLDLYSGPWDIMWLWESAENEALADRQEWAVPGSEGGMPRGFRPGTLPRLADRFVFDEQQYYYAIDATDEADAARRAAALYRHQRDAGGLREPFLRGVDAAVDLMIAHVDGWWEFYCGRPDWVARLRAAWPAELEERPIDRAWTPPGRPPR